MRVFESRKLLPVSVLLLLMTLAINAAVKDTAVVKDLSFNPNGDSLEVKIATSVHAQYTYFELSHPRRLVVDFRDVENGVGFTEKERLGAGGVERVRTSLFIDKNRKATRIVFDLEDSVPYKVSEDGGQGKIVRVVFGTKPVTSAPLGLTAGPAMIAEAVKITPEPVRTTPEAAKIIPEPVRITPEPAKIIPEAEAVKTPVIPSLPKCTPTPVPVVLKATVELPRTPVTSPAALAAVASRVSGGGRLSEAPMPAAQTTSQLPPALAANQIPQQYAGEITSFDLKDLDIKDFFRLIQNISGLNIILDPAVSGTVTLIATDLPWDQAFDIVLRNHQLGYQLQGNVVRIATNATLQAEETARKNLNDAKDLSAPLVTHSRVLNYTKSVTVAVTLNKLISPRGIVMQDPRRNAVIVTDIPTQFEKIDTMLDFLDAPAQQVEIEARLLSANKSFSRTIGSQLGFLLGNQNQGSVGGAYRRSAPVLIVRPSRLASIERQSAGSGDFRIFVPSGLGRRPDSG